MRIDAGELRHRVTIQQPTQTADGFGEVNPSWEDLKTVWGRVWPLSGRELTEAASVHGQVDCEVILRYESDLAEMDASWRLEFNGQTIEIVSVLNVEEEGEALRIIGRRRG